MFPRAAFSAPPPALAPVLAAIAVAMAACAPPPSGGVPAGGACERNLDCADGLACACGTCADPAQPGACASVPDAGGTCPDLRPLCFRTCGDFTPAQAPTCHAGAWRCSDGVLADACPPDQCWGSPQPGQVCVEGRWECRHGSVPGFGCITPDGCGVTDGGPAPAPGCGFDPDCRGDAVACRERWCAGAATPAVCARGRWVCQQGIALAQCTEACVGVPARDCLAACGDDRVVASSACVDGVPTCSAGVLAETCPPGTCWGSQPPGTMGCVDGAWLCADGGVAPDGGCAGALPADAGTQDASLQDASLLDAATPDAAQPPDASVPRDAGSTPADASAADAAFFVPDAGPAPPVGDPTTPACGQDILEPNNTLAQAGSPLVAGTYGSLPANGLLACDGDVDWTTFLVPAAGMMRVEVRHTGGPLDVMLFGPGDIFVAEALPTGTDMGITTLLLETPVASGIHGVVVLPQVPGPAQPASYQLQVVLP